VLSIGGVLVISLFYVALYRGYVWIQDKAKTELHAASPEFELLYIATEGRLKLRHLPSGREFLVNATYAKRRVQIRGIATRSADAERPEWLRLPDGKTVGDGKVSMLQQDAGQTRAALERLLSSRGFEIEDVNPGAFTSCSAKTLQCAFVTFGEGQTPGKTWYSVSWTEAP
jgi:hypothetical protein